MRKYRITDTAPTGIDKAHFKDRPASAEVSLLRLSEATDFTSKEFNDVVELPVGGSLKLGETITIERLE